jgi:hypothetical protein
MRWRISLGVAAVAAGLFAGCVPPTCINGGLGLGGTAGTPVFVEDSTQGFFFDHRPLEVVIDNLEVGQCTVPTSVQTLVKDPDDHVVSNRSGISTGSITGFGIHVSFDAGAPGWYFIQSNVQPNLEEAQLLVLENRRQTPLATLPFNAGCETLDQTAGGVWVCTPASHRDAGTPTQVLGSAARAFGASVWAYDPGLGSPSIVLYGEDAGALFQGDRLLQPSLLTVDGLAASSQGLVAASGSQLLWFAEDGGRIVATGSTVIPQLQGPLMLAIEGATVLIAGAPDGGVDAGTCTGQPPSTPCPGTFTACAVPFGASAAPASCQAILGTALGTDGALLWAVNDGTGRISAYGSDGGAFAFVASAPLSANLVAGVPGSFIVEIQPTDLGTIVQGTVVPTVQGIDVTYAFYDILQNGLLTGAGERFVWEPARDGGITVFPR